SNSSEYEYVGRLVTRERPILRLHGHQQQREQKFLNETPVSKLLLENNLLSKSYHGNEIHPTRAINGVQHFQRTLKEPKLTAYSKYQYQNMMEDDEDVDSYDDEDEASEDPLSKPIGVIRINDAHYREIYRLPTPPPKFKRIFHRLKSPEPKLIERVFVQRPPREIIENVIEVPPQRVRVVNKEKFLDRSSPITRSKLVRLHSKQHNRRQRDNNEELMASLQTTNVIPQTPMVTTTFPANQTRSQTLIQLPTTPANFTQVQQPQMFVGQQQIMPAHPQPTSTFIHTTIPPHIMFNSQQSQPHIPFQQPVQTSTMHQQQPQVITHFQQPHQHSPMINVNTLPQQHFHVPHQQQMMQFPQQPQMQFPQQQLMQFPQQPQMTFSNIQRPNNIII
ncbi:unnamed protein product, partial [Didymodactylos carnosus]